jgi:hypothetical protein
MSNNYQRTVVASVNNLTHISALKVISVSSFLGLLLVMWCNCSNDSRIIFPQIGTRGIIDGYVDPPGISAKVYLINVVVVDSVTADRNTGYFRFSDVAYGTYKLEAKADSFGTASTIVKLTSGMYTLGSVSLNRYPSQIIAISPRENSTISYIRSTAGSDTLVEFCFSFKKPVNRKTFEDHFLISPGIPFEISKETVTDYRHDIYITLSAIDVFSHPEITFTFKKGITSIYFEPLEFDYSVSYFPDTAKIEEVVNRYFFSSITPLDNSQHVNINTDIRFQFKKLMDRKSIEDALKIIPEQKYETLWQVSDNDGELLIVRFPKLLNKGTTYTVTIDSSASAKDLTKFKHSVSTRFSTDVVRCITFVPSSKEMYVPGSKLLTYTFNYPVDSASFIASFSITPPLDSLQFLFYDSKKSVMVMHPDFIIDTSYTVVIDSNLQTYSGEHIMSSVVQIFYTGLIDSQRTSTCIQNVYPADTISQVECGENILITFTGAMDRASVNERISISPALPVDLIWLSTATLQVKQLQPLQSNMKYTIVLDSGYMTQDHMVSGSGYIMQFKTKLLRLISYYPLAGQVNVSCDQDVMLLFSTPVDTISLLSDCYFNPLVDSLSCLHDKEGRYYIRHARFSNDTEYQFVVGNSITDKYGNMSGNSFSINFKTAKQ